MSEDRDPAAAGSGRSGGEVADGYEPVRALFDRHLREDSDHSAQLVVHVADRVVVDLWGGPSLGPDSITGVYSATKGIAALVVALLVQDGALRLDEPVATSWPEFGAHGKGAITVRQLLSHQAGLVNTQRGVTPEEFADSPHAAALLADTPPAWRPGQAFGYHALTIGPLVEELVRRATGSRLQHLYEQRIRVPHGIDFFLGLPDAEEHRYVPLRSTAPEQAVTATPPDDDYPTHALGLSDAVSPNLRSARRLGSASIGGIGSARGLARAYSAAVVSASPLVGSLTLDRMSELQVHGIDLVLGTPMRFGVLFMKPRPASAWGGVRAVGHDGAAGALAFADPSSSIAFGYIPNPSPMRGADVRAVELARLVRAVSNTAR